MNPPTFYVVPKLIGGLGNQLFILAAAVDVALRTNRTIIFHEIPGNCHCPDDRSLVDLFPTIPVCRNIVINKEYSGSLSTYIDIVTNIDPDAKTIFVSGYNQHPYYIPTLFCDFITNIPYVVPYVNRTDLAFLHVRRTDYVNHPCYECNTDVYYTAAVKDLVSVYPTINILIISDDTNWSNTYIKKLLENIIPNSQIMTLDRNYKPTDTLKIMANCLGGAICANSTFSWWGAYLNKNRPIYMPYPWSSYDTSPQLGLYFEGVKTISLKET